MVRAAPRIVVKEDQRSMSLGLARNLRVFLFGSLDLQGRVVFAGSMQRAVRRTGKALDQPSQRYFAKPCMNLPGNNFAELRQRPQRELRRQTKTVLGAYRARQVRQFLPLYFRIGAAKRSCFERLRTAGITGRTGTAARVAVNPLPLAAASGLFPASTDWTAGLCDCTFTVWKRLRASKRFLHFIAHNFPQCGLVNEGVCNLL